MHYVPLKQCHSSVLKPTFGNLHSRNSSLAGSSLRYYDACRIPIDFVSLDSIYARFRCMNVTLLIYLSELVFLCNSFQFYPHHCLVIAKGHFTLEYLNNRLLRRF